MEAHCGNRLINSLPADLQRALAPDCEAVSLTRSVELFRVGEVAPFVYFPTTCLISIIAVLENGSSAEATSVGNDGFAGIGSFIGGSAVATAMVQIAGEALRMDKDAFRGHLRDERLREALAPFVSQTFATMAQSVACFAYHPVTQRLARWLLIVRDCMQQDSINLTHEFLATMLGTHRPTVTIAVRELVSAELISTARGRIEIVDRDGLEEAACECYEALSTGRRHQQGRFTLG